MSGKTQRIYRVIVRSTFSQSPYTKRGQGQNELLLVCGHVRSQKTSQHVGKIARCVPCEQLRKA